MKRLSMMFFLLAMVVACLTLAAIVVRAGGAAGFRPASVAAESERPASGARS